MKSFSDYKLDEASAGHTIEAHGIRGMKGTPWRKTFKSHDHMHDWADKNDSVEIHATRDLEGVKKSTNEDLDEAKATYTIKDSEGNIKHAGTDKDIAYKTHKSLNAKESGHKLYKNGVSCLAEAKDQTDKAHKIVQKHADADMNHAEIKQLLTSNGIAHDTAHKVASDYRKESVDEGANGPSKAA